MNRRPQRTVHVVAILFVTIGMLWSLALFLRAAPYTPDEPREFDIAWNMLHQSSKAVPLLAGEPFCEKPPLTYWAAAASMSLFGATVPAARLPNLFWAAITVVCLLSWIRGVAPPAQSNKAMVMTALVACSSLLLFRVQIWLATDAPLVAATAIALLGAWCGFSSETPQAKFLGYLLFHLGLAAAFFAKNLLGWLAPIAALLGIVLWERRWRELLRWELYAGVIVQLALIVPWIAAVANHENGARLLQIFLIDNTLGRFLPIATEDQYELGHSNHPGKYLLELPYYLLPWTFAVVGAGRWALRQVRSRTIQAVAVRFTVVAVVPGLVFLSISNTARDVYAAPELLGFALLLGFWLGCGFDAADRFDRTCIRLTAALSILLGILLVALSIAIPELQGFRYSKEWFFVVPIAVIVVIAFAARLKSEWPDLTNLAWAWTTYVVGIIAVCVLLFPAFDTSQDLRPAARAVAREFGSRPIAILREDETIRAYMDFGGNVAAIDLRTLDDAMNWIEADAQRVLLVEISTDHVTPIARKRLAAWHERWGNLAPADVNTSAIELQRRGLRILWKYTVIGGRTYGVLGKD